jgi:dTDP-4-dehydrorhamnose 3,5-epimerase
MSFAAKPHSTSLRPPARDLGEGRLPEIQLLESTIYRDERGSFREMWNQSRHQGVGLPREFVQDNFSCSRRGVLRGLHYQHPRAQGKLVTVLQGEIFDVGVDLRVGSPTFGEWAGYRLTAESGHQLYIPEGFAHGFVALSDGAIVHYKCTAAYDPAGEESVLWSDPDLAIDWPAGDPTLSPKDARAPRLGEIPPNRLPRIRPEIARAEASPR